MQIIESKRNSLSIIALILGMVLLFVAAMEVIHMFFEEPIMFFFASAGDSVFETGLLDHLMKGFVALVIGGLFLNAYPKLKQGTLEGFAFLIGAGILALAIAFLYITVWIANLIDTALISIIEPEIWKEFIITDGIRIEWFIGIASIYILFVWKNRESYLIK